MNVDERDFERLLVEVLKEELAAANAGLAMVEATVAENELLRAMNERLATDLARAKAASAVTDEESSAAFEKWLKYECWECHRNICEATWQAAIRWMLERMKNQTPPTT
jgi:hypothetical protein